MAVYAIYICPWVSTVCVRNAFKVELYVLDGIRGCTEWMLMCVCVCVRLLLRNVISTSSALAVAGKELVKQQLQRHVLGHDVVFAQVMAAGRAGVHLRSERPLETSLG